MDFNLIKHFNYIYFSKEYDASHIKKQDKLLFFPTFWLKTAYHILINIRYAFKLKNPNGKLLFYCRSTIDYLSFMDVYHAVEAPKVLLMEKKFKKLLPHENLFPISISLLLSIFYTPAFIIDYFRYYRKSEHINYDSFLRGAEDIYMTYGRYAFLNLLFKFYKPTGIVVSNDHCYDTMIMIHFANKYNIPSIYIQHANVGDFFPRLDMSLALLEGEDAKQVYLKRGSDPDKIRLIGMPKYDNYASLINTNKKIDTIGIALNGLENLNTFHEDVIKIVSHFKNLKIIIRPHPILYTRHYKKEYQQFVNKLDGIDRILFSDSRIENPWEFLGKIDLQIAGDTSIHLEAILLNIVSVYYSNNTYYHSADFYRFNRNNTIPYFTNIDEMIKYLDSIREAKPGVRHKAKYYCATVESEYDGKSISLAAFYIDNYLKSFPAIPASIEISKNKLTESYV